MTENQVAELCDRIIKAYDAKAEARDLYNSAPDSAECWEAYENEISIGWELKQYTRELCLSSGTHVIDETIAITVGYRHGEWQVGWYLVENDKTYQMSWSDWYEEWLVDGLSHFDPDHGLPVLMKKLGNLTARHLGLVITGGEDVEFDEVLNEARSILEDMRFGDTWDNGDEVHLRIKALGCHITLESFSLGTSFEVSIEAPNRANHTMEVRLDEQATS